MTLLQSLVLALALAGGDDFKRYQREEIPTGTLYHWGWSKGKVDSLRTTIPLALRAVEKRLGKRIGHAFTSVLTPDGAEFRRMVAKVAGGATVSEWVVGVAVPAVRTLIIRGGLPPGYAKLRETLYHEIAHLVIHEGRSTAVPRWLDEGAAMWSSNHRLEPSDEAFVALLARVGQLYSLKELTHKFPAAHKWTARAYLQSLLFVTFLVEKHGRAIVPQLLAQLSSDNTEAVLGALTGLSTEALEKKFSRWVAARTSVLWALSALWNIWTVCALLAVIAIVRHRVRRRRALRRLERMDEDFPDEV